ncbi:hypothetical protein BDF20DRAFT_801095, partial [Mycotypha africana]|uniref:uncharacterized protein n=1 Tax=Mycotypha africana TaxID=64632 RepID=UPI0023003605
FPDGYFFVKSQAHGLVLTVLETGLLAAEVVVTQLDTSNYSGQLWKYEEGYLINKSSELVLDVPGGKLFPSASIIQWHAKVLRSSRKNQMWGLSVDGHIHPQSCSSLVLSIDDSIVLKEGAELKLAKRGAIILDYQQW